MDNRLPTTNIFHPFQIQIYQSFIIIDTTIHVHETSWQTATVGSNYKHWIDYIIWLYRE